MKSYYTLAWKELRTQKVTAILILIAITLSTIMTTVVGQSIGILNAMRKNQAINLNGNRYATFHQLTEEQANNISLNDEITFAEKIIQIGDCEIPNSKVSITLREFHGNSILAYPQYSQLEKGTLPEKANEIALSRDILELLGFEGEIKDTLSLNVDITLLMDTKEPYEYIEKFVLTGILKTNYVGYANGFALGIVGEGTAKQILPERYKLYSVDIITKNKETFQNTIDDITQSLAIEEFQIQYNDILLRALGIPYRTENEEDIGSGFSYMFVVGILIGILVLFAAGLVIYNILKIAVTKRVKEYGTLRAIGAEKGHLYRVVTLQLALLCGVGIPIGVLLGAFSTKGILSAATSFFTPDIFMANSSKEVLNLISDSAGGKVFPFIVSIAITLLFAFIASMPAARYATRVSPTVAMVGRITTVKRRNRNPRNIRNFEAFYARMNMKRNRSRTVITILSLVMSITVFVTLQSFSGLLDSSVNVQQMLLGDYSLTSQNVGFSPEDVENLKSNADINSISTLKYNLYQSDKAGKFSNIETSFTPAPGETIQIIGLDNERLISSVSNLSEHNLQKLLEGSACIITNPYAFAVNDTQMQSTVLSIGENILVNNTELTIVGILDTPITIENEGFVNGVQIIVIDEMYNKLTNQGNYTELYITISETANREVLEQSFGEICKNNAGTWLSYEDTYRQLKESYEQIRLLAWGLIFFIGLIGILNIINTVYTNIHTRVTEIGVQRAIGMSQESLYKTFLWEGVYYGIIAAVIGSIAGYICTIFVSVAATDKVELVAIPVLSITGATIISIISCLIATCIPLRKIATMNIVESIENAE